MTGAMGRALSGLFLITTLIALAGCQRRAELHIAIVPWVGYETLTLADEFDWLPPSVVLHRVDTATESVDALLRGEVQAAGMTLDQALRVREQLSDLTIVLVMDESAGADVILARPDIHSVADLKGRTVGYEASALHELILDDALARAGLSVDDVTLVELLTSDHHGAYARGEVDAVVCFPPFSHHIEALGARPVYDSGMLPETIFDVLAVRRSSLVHREELLVATIAAHFKALEHLRSSREDAVYRFASYQGSDARSVRRALGGVKLPTLEAVRAHLQADGAVTRAALKIAGNGRVTVDEGTLQRLSDPRYLPGRD